MRERIDYLDTIKAIALFLVISIHNMGSVTEIPGTSDHFLRAIWGVFQPSAVPLFYMVTGVLLLTSQNTIREFLSRRFKRILLPFFFWSVVLFGISVAIRDDISFFDFPVALINGDIHGVYWYVYSLLGLYLVIPIMSTFIGKWNLEGGFFLVAVWIFHSMYAHFFPDSTFVLPFYSDPVGYCALGYLCNQVKVRSSLAILSLGFFSSVSFFKGYFIQFYDFELLIPVMSVSIFLVFKSVSIQGVWQKTSAFLGQWSYGIYLAHVLVISGLCRIGVDTTILPLIVSLPLLVVIDIAIVVFILFMLLLVPPLRPFIGASFPNNFKWGSK